MLLISCFALEFSFIRNQTAWFSSKLLSCFNFTVGIIMVTYEFNCLHMLFLFSAGSASDNNTYHNIPSD